MSVFKKQKQNQKPVKRDSKDAASDLKQKAQALLTRVSNQHDRVLRSLWENPDFSAEEILAALDKEAGELVKASAALNAAVKLANPELAYTVPDGAELVVAADGTVKVKRK